MAEAQILSSGNTAEIGVGSQSPFKDGAWLKVLRSLDVEAELLMIHRDPAQLVTIWLKQLDEGQNIDLTKDIRNRLDIPEGNAEKVLQIREELRQAIIQARRKEDTSTAKGHAHAEALDLLEERQDLTTVQLIVNNGQEAINACRDLQNIDNIEFRVALPLRKNFSIGEQEEDIRRAIPRFAAETRQQVAEAIRRARAEERTKLVHDEGFLARLDYLEANIKIPGENNKLPQGKAKFIVACTDPGSGTDAMPFGMQTGDGGEERTRRARVLNPGLAVYVGAMENGIEAYVGGELDEAFTLAVEMANKTGAGMSILRTKGESCYIDRPLIVLHTWDGEKYRTSYCIGPGVQFPNWAIEESQRSKKEFKIKKTIEQDIPPSKVMKGTNYKGEAGMYPDLLEQFPDNDPHSFFNMIAGVMKDGVPESRLDMIAGFMVNFLQLDQYAQGLQIISDDDILKNNPSYTLRKVQIGDEEVTIIQDNRVTLYKEGNLINHVLTNRVGRGDAHEREDCLFFLEKYGGLTPELAATSYDQALAFKDAIRRIDERSRQEVLDVERLTAAVKLLPAPKNSVTSDNGAPFPGETPLVSGPSVMRR